MATYRTSQKEDLRRISMQAAEWLQAMRQEPSAQERAAFAEWIALSQQHLQEFLIATMLERELVGVDPQRRFDVERIAEQARVSTVVTFDKPAKIARPRSPAEKKFGLRYARWAAALSGIALLSLAAWWQSQHGWGPPREYRTATGEQRTFSLPDGSVVELNALSRLTVHFSGETRELHLRGGEALFKVAPDVARPFRVRTDDNTIQAIGTQFNVNRRQSGVTVSVIEGKVRVSAGRRAPANVAAGEEVRIAADGQTMTRNTLDAVQATSWRQRRLSFHGETLEDIAEEFNRYNDRHIQVEDDEAGARRFNGVFDASDPDSFVEFLRRNTPLAITSGADGFAIGSRPGN